MASESASRAFMSDAKELVDAGQFGKAIEVLQEGLKKFPKMVSARVLLGEIYRTSGDLALARTELEQVIKAAPDNFAAYRKLALVYRDLEDKPAALKACETILKANPKDREMGQLRDQLQGGKGGKAKAGDKAALSKKAKRSEKREAAKTEGKVEAGVEAGHATKEKYAAISEQAKRAERREAATAEETVKEVPVTVSSEQSPVADHAAREAAGAGRSLPMEGAGDITDTE